MEHGKKLIRFGMLFLGMLLGIGLIGLALLPFAFPVWESGNFYSSDFMAEPTVFDFVQNYIPANPFASMSDNIVPAVVLFSIFVGLGVMKLPNKEVLLKPLEIMNTALNQVNKMIVKITPIGVFCIAGGIMSQLSISDLSRLQGYLFLYLLAVVLLSFIVLPYVLSVFTPYPPKAVFKLCRSTLITIFATGKIIVVYPQLIENIKEIIRADKNGNKEAESEVDIVMPLAYPFPNLGTFMIFIFVPFAAWFTGKAIGIEQYPIFLSSTLLSSFVAPITGLPFSLNLLDIPKETFNLFVVSTVLTDRIRVVLGAIHLIVLTLLTISASQGFLKFNLKKLIPGILISLTFSIFGIVGMNYLLTKNMEGIPTNMEIINGFKLISKKKDYKIEGKSIKNPNPKWRGENTLSRIKRRKALRVGFYSEAIPFSFYNTDSLLVGYGIDVAHQLANDLDVAIEFVPIEEGGLINELGKDFFDIVVSDFFISGQYAQEISLSKPYMNVSLALLVKKEFKLLDNFEKAVQLDTFTIAYVERADIANEFVSYFPNAGAISVSSKADYFNSTPEDSLQLDAFLTSAENASTLTIFHPEYKLVNPLPYHISNALVFPVARDEVWRRYIDKWIDFRKQDGTLDNFYKQWILGIPHKKESKTWSVYDNIIIPKLKARAEARNLSN